MDRRHLRIGTSGFSYRDWLGNFYPQFCPQADFLKFYSSKFTTVEIDASFYRIPSVETVRKWAGVTPEDFVFTAKFPRTVTHEGTLESRREELGRFVEVMKHLGGKLGPLLLQFPYSFKPDRLDDLTAIVESLPPEGRFAVEMRNRKWLEIDSLMTLLSARGIALCLVDHPWMPRFNIKTAPFIYIRFLGDHRKIENDFTYVRSDREDDLHWWRQLVVEYLRDNVNCYIYFNNHYSGHAPTTAARLRELVSEP
ncbi:MAG: DUF72 domain-containing protein [Candidatus Zixiibacteriota bacterium]|nr:MAG: DUF72 domain-containing protein [candidate division Zixibacteria bacterium]